MERGGAGVKGGNHLMIAAQFEPQRLGNALSRKVVLGGAQSAGENDDLRTGERDLAGLQKMLRPVADNRLEDDFHAKLIETLRQEQGIRVLAVGRQELGANSYDLSVHA
jgi:hypothetical protein